MRDRVVLLHGGRFDQWYLIWVLLRHFGQRSNNINNIHFCSFSLFWTDLSHRFSGIFASDSYLLPIVLRHSGRSSHRVVRLARSRTACDEIFHNEVRWCVIQFLNYWKMRGAKNLNLHNKLISFKNIINTLTSDGTCQIVVSSDWSTQHAVTRVACHWYHVKNPSPTRVTTEWNFLSSMLDLCQAFWSSICAYASNLRVANVCLAEQLLLPWL